MEQKAFPRSTWLKLRGGIVSRRESTLAWATPTAPILVGMSSFFLLRPDEYEAVSRVMRSLVVIASVVASMASVRVIQRRLLAQRTLAYYRSVRRTLSLLLALILGIAIYNFIKGGEHTAMSSLGTFAFGAIMLLHLKRREGSSAEQQH